MRGVASGGDGNHSGSLPSVGVYLDEQPITTIQGPLDMHVYDIERVEALSGPQGTLYGASSQAGTLRMITNKPDPSGFRSRAMVLELNRRQQWRHGVRRRGLLNLPISDAAAIRLVGWHKKDAGYIDNVYATRTFPSWDADSNGNGTIDNAALVDDDYNDVETTGARIGLARGTG
jgi:outer membrane receptor protein involved in Fe transport